MNTLRIAMISTCLLITVCGPIWSQENVTTPWSIPMTVTSNGSNHSLRLGAMVEATDEFDNGKDILAPPTPPYGLYTYFRVTGFFNNLEEDYRLNSKSPNSWTLVIAGTQGAAGTVTWNSSGFPSGDIAGSLTINGTNMLTLNSLPFTGDQTMTISYSAPQQYLRLSVKVFLEGAYQADGAMKTNLSASHRLPATSPYGSAPAESNNITAEIVDWILLELRQEADGPISLQRSVLLRNDGYLIDVDGSSTELKLVGLSSGNYYIVMNHRNHLAMMSATAVGLALVAPFYDFTASADQIFGDRGGKEVQSGIWGMWAGDVNQDGSVNLSDYAIWDNSARLGEKGYRTADIDCDGQVTTADYFHWYSSQRENAVSQVPALAP